MRVDSGWKKQLAHLHRNAQEQFAAGRPDAADAQQLREFSLQLRQQLEQPAKHGPVKVPGNQPYREYHGVPFKPKTRRRCNSCGLCAEHCPVQAISTANPRITDEAKCLSWLFALSRRATPGG